MSDIRLKVITVEPTNYLTIQNGYVNITNTSISNNILNGALVIDGGIGVNCTSDSISSTSGGAMSIGGGLSVIKKTFLGNNLTLDNNSSIITVNGINTPRLFLDTISNKHFSLAPDGINTRFDLYDTYININITTNSINCSTGALIIQGGISINTTFDALNSSYGGALTVAGGIGINGNSIFGKSITLGQTGSTSGIIVRYLGTNNGGQIVLTNISGGNSVINNSGNNLVISNNDIGNINIQTSIGNIVFSNISTNNTLLTITGKNSIFGKWLSILDSTNSSNLTTGSIISVGGISINNNTDAISFTAGGSATFGGGIGISKKTYTGDSIGIELLNGSKNNKLMLYQTNQDLTQTNLFSGFGINNTGSLRLQIPNITNDFIFYSSNTSGTTSNEVFRIKGTNQVNFIGNNQQYSIIGGGFNNNSLSLQSQGTGDDMSFDLFTYDGDLIDNIDMKIFGMGLPNSINNSEYLNMGFNKTNLNYILSVNSNGTGIQRPLVLQTGGINQLQLNIDNTINLSTTTSSINSTTGGLVLSSGGLSINNTTNSTSLTSGGCLTIAGGASINKSLYIGNTFYIKDISFLQNNITSDLIINIPTNNLILSGNTIYRYSNVLTLLSLNNGSNYESLTLKLNNTASNAIYQISSNQGGSGLLFPIQINVGNNIGIFENTNGNIGINTTNPQVQFDINGTFNANNYTQINELTIYNTNDATSIFSSGSLSVEGGTSIAKSLFVGGPVTFTNTNQASGSSGALIVYGGISVLSNESSNYGIGALTVAGGGSFGGELYIGQNLFVNGTINGGAGASNSFSYLTITATDNAINLSTGCLLTFGGITIQSGQNAANVSNGGSILTAGGASIGQDLYIGGHLFNYGQTNYFYEGGNSLINFYDNTNILRFSIDRNITSNDLSISRYNSIGTLIEKTLNISNNTGIINLSNSTPSINITSGSIVTQGGITILSNVSAGGLNNGGGLTVLGGTSISKNLFVGSDTIFYSTTQSTNVSNGSIIVHGGMGIGGNVNILGDTLVYGNLTIVGSSTSIQSSQTLLNDNIIIVNAGPSGSKDAGFMTQRWQYDNNIGSGDVISDIPYYTDNLPSQSGMSTTQIKLSSLQSSVDNFYIGWWIKVTSGFSTNQVRQITGYIGSSRIATIDTVWLSQNPATNDTIALYNKPYVGLVFSEINNRFEFGSTVQSPGESSLILTDTVPIYFSAATSTSTQPSTSSSIGGIISIGGISIGATTDASSLGNGGGLTVAGGASIQKTLIVGNVLNVNGVNMTPNTNDIITTTLFTGSNNVTSPSNITGLLFNNSVWGFDIYLSVQVIATTNLYSNYQIRGINMNSSWQLITEYVGDPILTLSITNSGQIQYTCNNYSGFVSLIMKFKAITN